MDFAQSLSESGSGKLALFRGPNQCLGWYRCPASTRFSAREF